jgi:Mrp family chromosome partitioning ATPase
VRSIEDTASAIAAPMSPDIAAEQARPITALAPEPNIAATQPAPETAAATAEVTPAQVMPAELSAAEVTPAPPAPAPAVSAVAANPSIADALSERRPLSAFAAPPSVEDAFRPHLEVDNFIWPAAVSTLLERAGQGLTSFAAQLTAQAAAGEKVLALSGPRRKGGFTTVALAIARQVAACGGRAVIVDADFEKPDVARCLGIAASAGWEQVLRGELPLEDVLITSLQDRVAIVPCQPPSAATSSAPFDPLRANLSLGMLRDHYDVVLVDGGPLIAADSGLASLVRAARFDGCYLVRDARPQAAGAMTDAVRVARELGLRIFGAVENFSNLVPQSAGGHRTAT